MFVQELGERVRAYPCLGFQDTGRFRRGRDPEHRPTLCVEVIDRGGEHARLSRAGRADDHHQPIPTRHLSRSSRLKHVEPSAFDRP